MNKRAECARSILANVPVGYGMTYIEALGYVDAVLDALMEPTEEMISAADEAMRHRVVTGSARIETLKVGLLAMIQAAKEGK